MTGIYVEPVGVIGLTGEMDVVVQSTFATIKSSYPASSYSGKFAFATDIGNGALLRSNGTRWSLMSIAPLYNTGSSTTVVTNTTAETQVASFTLPGGLPGPNGYVRLLTMLSHTNSANTKTLRIKFNGTTVITNAIGGLGSASAYGSFTIRNCGSESSQKGTQGASGVGTTSAAVGTSSINTASDVTVTITMQMGALAETSTLEHLLVEVGSGV